MDGKHDHICICCANDYLPQYSTDAILADCRNVSLILWHYN